MDYKKDFPTLNQTVHGKPLFYLDNAATTQKPVQVLEAVDNYYNKYNANPHRGAYQLSIKATELYENARLRVRDFIGAKSADEIIFTKGATEAFNIVSYCYGMHFINEGDEIVISIAEHHSNLVPWQQVAAAKKATLKYLYVDDNGQIPQSEIDEKITEKTKLVSVALVSNVLGTVFPVAKIVEKAHSVGAVVMADLAQAVPHMKVDVTALDVDFAAFSGHKMLAPMGIGVLYGKKDLLKKMPPFLYGGDMIEYVKEQTSTFAKGPQKFEGGTQNVGGAVGLVAAIDYIEKIGFDKIEEIEHDLTEYALKRMSENPYVKITGCKTADNRAGVISFIVEDVHPHDVSSILDADGIAIRSGHHCAHPLMTHLGLIATCRMSVYFYNTKEEIDAFVSALSSVRKWLKLS